MSEANVALAKRWFEEVWNKSRREAIDDMLAPQAVLNEGGTSMIGPEGFKPFFDRMHAAFSEIQVTIEDAVAQGDKVCVRWSCSLKHTGDGIGIAATGKHVTVSGMTLIRIEGGRFVEGWQNWDMLGLMQQLQETPMAATYVAATA